MSTLDELLETQRHFWPLLMGRNKGILCHIILRFVNANPSTTMGELADFIGLSQSAASQAVERLVEDKMIARQDDKSDRRVVRLKLTKKGQEELEKTHKAKRERLQKIFSHIPERDLKEYLRIQKELLKILKAENA